MKEQPFEITVYDVDHDDAWQEAALQARREFGEINKFDIILVREAMRWDEYNWTKSYHFEVEIG